MSDPKYVNLYGIAHDQPDVFETSDLPEADQHTDIYEQESKAVELLHISASDAFSKFCGKKLDSSSADFSGSINKILNTPGYRASSGHWELAGFGEKETPLQKYSRLKLEISELIEELSEASKKSQEDDKTIAMPDLAHSLTKEADVLFRKMMQLELERSFGVSLNNDNGDLQGISKLRNKIQSFNLCESAHAVGDDKVEDSAEVNVKVIGYQLSVKPGSSALVNTSRILEMERKLDKIESLLGNPTDEFSRLCALSPGENGILGCVQWMLAKLTLLDLTQLEAIENKATTLVSRLDQLIEKGGLGGILDPEKEKKINELYALSNKAREFSDLMPTAISQMAALHSLHEQAKHTIEAVGNVELVQKEVTSSVAKNEDLMKNIRESVGKNIRSIQCSINALEKRVSDLVKKQA